MNHQKLTAHRASQLLGYDSKTGALIWKARTGCVVAGAKVHSVDRRGYLVVRIDGVRYMAHRVAWLLVNGAWPEKWLDHIDGSKTNNVITNLREASPSENAQNKRRPLSSNKSSSRLGVSRNINTRKWVAYITVAGAYKHLGTFDSEESAYAVYLAAKAVLHPFSMLTETANSGAP